MYLFFLTSFIIVSIILIVLILFQSEKEVNNIVHTNSQNYIKLFNNTGSNSFITKSIAILSGLFLIISIILCNINNKNINSNVFLENYSKHFPDLNIMKKELSNKEIPH